jgi:hypothetical protein
MAQKRLAVIALMGVRHRPLENGQFSNPLLNFRRPNSVS